MRLVQEGRYIELLQNQRVINALNDPTVIEQFKAIDWKRALDFATQAQQTAR